MATNLEIKVVQKSTLFDLLIVKKEVEASGGTLSPEFLKMLARAEATMDEADVAWVEKKISELP